MSVGFIFPGQGSHSVGMGVSLAGAFSCARDVFCEIDDALSFSLSRLMRDGPLEELTLTENAQPALLAVSAAVLRVLEHEGGIAPNRAHLLAGHSLGEYSALYAARVFSLGDAVRLVRLRGKAMQEAVPADAGLMAAIIGLDYDSVLAVAREASALTGGVCVVANDNAPAQIVLSGDRPSVENAVSLAKEAGAKRAMILPVSAPFHCPLMAPAAEIMEEALARISMIPPSVSVVANIRADILDEDIGVIRDNLVRQITGMVRWRESMEFMLGNGVERFYELGEGRVLCGLMRRISPDAHCLSVAAPETLEVMIEELA